MKILIFIFGLIALFSGCSMQKYCSERYPATERVRDSISYVEKVTFRDTLIYVSVPYESKSDTIYVDASNSAYSTLTTAFAWSYAFFKDGKMIHYLQQKDSLIEVNLKNAIKEHSTVEYRDREIIKVEIRNELTGWQHSQIYAAWILAGILLVSALWRKLPTALIGKAMQVFKKKKPP